MHEVFIYGNLKKHDFGNKSIKWIGMNIASSKNLLDVFARF